MRKVLPFAVALSAALVLLVGGTASGYAPAPVETWVASGGFFGGGSVQTVAVSGSTAYIGGYFNYIGPATGSLVSVDTTSSALSTPWPLVGGSVSAVVSDGQGGWFIGGSFGTIGEQRVDNLAHIKADGTLDTGWAGSVDGAVKALVLAGGKLYVGGEFLAALSGGPAVGRAHLAAFDAATGALTSFDPFPTMSQNSVVSALAIFGSTLYVGGYFDSIGAVQRLNLAAVDTTNGTLTSWAPSVDDLVNAISVGPSGTVYVAGFFATANDVDRPFAVAFTAGGTLTAWNPEPSAPVDAVKASASSVYIGGDFTVLGDNDTRNGLAAVDPATGAPTSWNPSVDGVVNTLEVSGSTVYAGGRFRQVGGSTSRDNLAAFDVGTGAPTALAPMIGGTVNALAVAGSKVAVGGGFTTAGSSSVPSLQPVRRSNLAAIDLTTGKPTSWHGAVDDGYVFALALSGSNLIVGGDFTSVDGGVPRNDLASFSLSTSAATNWNPNVLGRVYAVALSGSDVYVGGQFDHVNGSTPRNGLAAFPTTGTGTALAWAPTLGANEQVLALDAIGGTIYIGGAFTTINGVARSRLAAVDTSGTLTPWNPNASDSVYALTHVGSTVYAGGGFHEVNGGVQRGGAAAFETAGTGTATAWNPRPGPNTDWSGWVATLAHTDSAMYLGGWFDTVGACPSASCTSSPNLAGVTLSTGDPLTMWRPGVDNYVWALGIAPQGLVAGGFFNTVGTRPDLPQPVEADPSYQSGFALLHTPPDAPTVRVTPGDGSLVVTASEPAYTGGAPITTYSVSVSPGGASASTSNGPMTLTGLTNGVLHTLTVTATSSAGTGPATVVNGTPGTSVREPEPPEPPGPTPRPETPDPPTITAPRPPPPHHS
jgi:hypothetical protein